MQNNEDLEAVQALVGYTKTIQRNLRVLLQFLKDVEERLERNSNV